MKTSYEIAPGLLESFSAEVKEKHLPVHIQQGIKLTDENGNEIQIAEFEYPDNFDFNTALSKAICRYCHLV